MHEERRNNRKNVLNKLNEVLHFFRLKHRVTVQKCKTKLNGKKG